MSADLAGWVRVAATVELLPGESTVVWDGATPILVVNLEGDFHALEDRCSHQDFERSAGAVDAEAGTIECVLHAARFDLRTGVPLCGPAYAPVPRFPVRVVDGAVWTRDDR